jgi:hypothetical protein
MHTKGHTMHATIRSTSLAAAALLSVGMGSAMAAAPRESASEIQAQYEHERSVCLSGRSNQDQATCLREAAAARGEARRGLLDDPASADYRRNALERCRVFKGEEATECRARISGAGRISGSVGAGGILRELVTIEPAPPPPDTPTQ